MFAQDLIGWTEALCLPDDARVGAQAAGLPPADQSGRIARHARRTVLRLARDRPWSSELAAAFARRKSLPAPAG